MYHVKPNNEHFGSVLGVYRLKYKNIYYIKLKNKLAFLDIYAILIVEARELIFNRVFVFGL